MNMWMDYYKLSLRIWSKRKYCIIAGFENITACKYIYKEYLITESGLYGSEKKDWMLKMESENVLWKL